MFVNWIGISAYALPLYGIPPLAQPGINTYAAVNSLVLLNSGNSFVANDGDTVAISGCAKDSVTADTWRLYNQSATPIVADATGTVTGDGTYSAAVDSPYTIASGSYLQFNVTRTTNVAGARSYVVSIASDEAGTPFTTTFNFNVTPAGTDRSYQHYAMPAMLAIRGRGGRARGVI